MHQYAPTTRRPAIDANNKDGRQLAPVIGSVCGAGHSVVATANTICRVGDLALVLSRPPPARTHSIAFQKPRPL